MKFLLKKVLSCALCLCLTVSMLTGCDISSKHLEMKYDENNNKDIVEWDNEDNDNVTDWDTADISTWDDIDEYSDWIYSQIVFDNITDEYPIIECKVYDYQSNGVYFDGEKIYSMVGDKFDVNSFVTKYAIGTGVIVICVILTVATAGGTSPFVCFIAGAADGAVEYAVKGAAFSAAMETVTTSIKTGGDIEETLYGTLEGSADGYMWGAMYGAITGGLNSTYCFTENTLVLTEAGEIPISDINVGDKVYCFNEKNGIYEYSNVTQVTTDETKSIVSIYAEDDVIESTLTHPFLTNSGWKQAAELKTGDLVLSKNNEYVLINQVKFNSYEENVTTYTLCVEDNHNFMVGQNNLVVHNRCNINSEYAGKTYELTDPKLAAKYPKGVPFTKAGYPDFSGYASKTVKCQAPSQAAFNATSDVEKCLTGNYSHDFGLANRLAGFKETPAGFTWHHKDDMMTMQLIPTDLHMGVRHNGGASLIRELLSII